MKMKAVYLCCMLVLFAGIAPSARAVQEGADQPPRREKMENVRERIGTLRMWKMTKALDLDEKTSAQVFPIMNKYDKKRADLEVALREDMRELRESVRDNKGSRLRPLLDRLEQNHDSLGRLNQDEWRELKQILTVEQQAKYVIFKQEFEREMRQMIGEAKERRMERAGKRQEGMEPRPLPQR